MYVKSLTLKGFKSFASATHLAMEPGITAIVGPNGSGKSNVVDALAWVMGEGSARTLRGGKMDDVIFAGTAGRPALGRAEVTLTIDNSDGQLPIDYSEVTISRTMFRGGGSEYSINRTPCRLLDIQELLSDSGIGREMHVIVGQGQLDAVLRATPEERRGFIEEAAGVLKHRRRKEKALRKLDAMEGNLTRVTDLAAEVRRQLGPLGRQAETARRAQTIQHTVRDARLRLLADDLLAQRTALNEGRTGEEASTKRREELEAKIAEQETQLKALNEKAAKAAPLADELTRTWYDLSAMAEKFAATGRIAAERSRDLVNASQTAHSGRDPQQLRQQAEKLRGEEKSLREQVQQLESQLVAATSSREEAESAHQAEQQRLVRLARAAADRREGLAKLRGQVEVRRSRTESVEKEIARLTAQLDEANEQETAAQSETDELRARLQAAETREQQLNEQADGHQRALAKLVAQRDGLRNDINTATQRAGAASARVEALEMTLGAASEATVDEADASLLGGFLDQLQVSPGYEASVNVALGWACEALVVTDHESATRLLAGLRESGGGRTQLVVAEPNAKGVPARPQLDLPDGAEWVLDVVQSTPAVSEAVQWLLYDIAIVPDAQAAGQLVAAGARAVTQDGDFYGPAQVVGGGAPARSALEIRAAIDEARAEAQTQTAAATTAQEELDSLAEPLRQAQQNSDDALDALYDNDADIASAAEALNRLVRNRSTSHTQRDKLTNALDQARVALEETRAELEELQERLTQAEQAPEDEEEPSVAERDKLAQQAASARTEETEIRLTLRSHSEQLRHLIARAESLESSAKNEEAARRRAEAAAAARAEAATLADHVAKGAESAHRDVVLALEHLGEHRERISAENTARNAEITQVRNQLGEFSEELRKVTDAAHRLEVARTQQRLRVEALETKALDELGIEPDTLIAEYGPDQPVDEQGTEFVRADQENRLKHAEKDLKELGKINPLALEEFAALEERHTFLSEQLADLRSSKKDLLDIVREVDERVEQVFTEAFADVQREFEGVFSRLFPGGQGRLVLTDPENMLTTGLDVEARPPGKKIKRLSLLSGGERSLVAVAFLVSIFKARPSPFYIMDEVEAALDDANLSRLLTLFDELRASSQLIVITHQKRTMEVADALYGVSMRGDGVTTVVSQRLADVGPKASG